MPLSVADFVLTDARVARHIEGSGARDVPEKLLVAEDGGHLGVSLYLDPALLERLDTHDPFTQLHDGNLAEFMLVLEGVSHFVYLAWNAGHARGISLLELEMQAEVDKFVTASALLRSQGEALMPPALHDWLFRSCRFDESLEPEARRRYDRASRMAEQYCAHLLERYMRGTVRDAGLVRELRRFYRLTHRPKIRYILGASSTA